MGPLLATAHGHHRHAQPGERWPETSSKLAFRIDNESYMKQTYEFSMLFDNIALTYTQYDVYATCSPSTLQLRKTVQRAFHALRSMRFSDSHYIGYKSEYVMFYNYVAHRMLHQPVLESGAQKQRHLLKLTWPIAAFQFKDVIMYLIGVDTSPQRNISIIQINNPAGRQNVQWN